ncbi:MAG: arginine--tRNA ligase [Bacteroidales bacterium]
MAKIEEIIFRGVKNGCKNLYQSEVADALVQLQMTRKDFEGDITLVVFPLLKLSRKNPEQTGNEIGNYLVENLPEIEKYNVIKGFLNLTISPVVYISALLESKSADTLIEQLAKEDQRKIMVEYSSPNTNKPLHLGHIRNNLLGYSISSILQAVGHEVIKVNLVNDRGIHICKSMLAWQKWGNGETPESSGKKGDKLVGDYYVMFDKEYKKQIQALVDEGMKKEEAEKKAPLILEAQEMLRKWEAGDKGVNELWQMMNQWVYDGFNITYERMGVDFDKIYYESETYLLGKKIVLEGLEKGILYKRDDNSVWADLKNEGLDEKLLLRSDGTSVYMTQDIGTAVERFDEFNMNQLIYVVGNEQNYHFQVLAVILKKLGYNWADTIRHLSYGMVELPEGKMKSREGTVVDADDLMDEMIKTAREMSLELGKLDDFESDEAEQVFRTIGMGALKYFILKVDPRKNMLFDPRESVDFNGNTGPFIQYTHARVKSLLRKANERGLSPLEKDAGSYTLNDKEKELVKLIGTFPGVVKDAAIEMSPALIANFVFDLAREYNQFYHDYQVLREEDEMKRSLRLILSDVTGKVISEGMNLLGIEVPERM